MRLVPTQTLLETTGRKSGQARRIPVGGLLEDGRFWLVSEFGERSQYVRNIVADPRVRVRVRGRWHSGTAHLLPEDDAGTRLAALPTMASANQVFAGPGLIGVADGDAGFAIYDSCAPFADGFESGDTSTWSVAEP